MAEDNLEVPVFPTITPGTTEDSDSSQGSDGEANKKADPIVVADKEKKVDAEADNADAKADDSKKDPAKTEEERKLQVRGKSKEDFIAERKQKQLDKLDAQIEAKRKEAETN